MAEKFTPQAGQIYQNINGYTYLCLDAGYGSPYRAIMQSLKSLWTFIAVDCRLYEDGRIDWAYSTSGFFANDVQRKLQSHSKYRYNENQRSHNNVLFPSQAQIPNKLTNQGVQREIPLCL